MYKLTYTYVIILNTLFYFTELYKGSITSAIVSMKSLLAAVKIVPKLSLPTVFKGIQMLPFMSSNGKFKLETLMDAYLEVENVKLSNYNKASHARCLNFIVYQTFP